MVQLCYWSKTLSHFSPSFSTTPSIFFLSLSLLHNSYLSIFLSISFFMFSFSFQPPLALALMQAFLPLVGLAGFNPRHLCFKAEGRRQEGAFTTFFSFLSSSFFSHSFIIIFRCICLICAFCVDCS